MTKLKLLFLMFFSAFSVFAEKEPLNDIPESAQKVYVGMYLMNVYDMDLEANSFYADFYLWCKWKGDIDPLTDLEFVNYVEKWGFTKIPLYDTIQILDDGSKYNCFRIEGRFYHAFSLAKFPVDEQALDVQVENSVYTIDSLVYILAEKETGFKQELLIPGWDIKNLGHKMYKNAYKTNFGDTRSDGNESYSNITFELYISRPINFFLWKLLLPLLVVLISGLGTTIMHPAYIDARIATPVGALLSAIFLQQSYTSNLPDVGYMVMMDKIYVLSYIVILLGLLQAIITANWASSEEEEDFKRVKKFDYIFVSFSMVTYFVVAVLIVTNA